MIEAKMKELEERQQRWSQEIFEKLEKLPMEQAHKELLQEVKDFKGDLRKATQIGQHLADAHKKLGEAYSLKGAIDNVVAVYSIGIVLTINYMFAILQELFAAKTLAQKQHWVNKMEDFAKNFESYQTLAQNFYFMDAKNLLELTDRVDVKELAERAPQIVAELDNSFQAVTAETNFDRLDNYAKAANFILELDTASGLDRENAVIAMDFANAMFDAGLDKDDIASLKLLNQYIMDNEINYTPDMELTRDIVAKFLEEVAEEKDKNRNEKQKETQPERAL